MKSQPINSIYLGSVEAIPNIVWNLLQSRFISFGDGTNRLGRATYHLRDKLILLRKSLGVEDDE